MEHQTCFSPLSELTDDFHERFVSHIEQTTDRHGDERARLYFDRGESSLDNQDAYVDRIYLLNNKIKSMGKSLSLIHVKGNGPEINLSSSHSPEQNTDIEGNLSQRDNAYQPV